ncbi:MAG: PH domain-containing protein [Mesorhizobium sp.]|uniref:PH domain-containing protein n=1 Tax=unclassified Mesorhizobium TaxID=325217 RepID=UPI000F7504FC|nr:MULTISPECIES: PH domain-containing protein [unclassified Mesorhizobium]AZO52552.1 PH domain-containing protein [Mesorhizobium sp. M8A.F.Ca.ET.057.01.1.1]RWE39333.1 MAG: PH domain-containing protein [Mesorhizobium sp.]RWE43761.1 MAG: PH domain-containing protein [Mesorhizobium sp.]
MDVGTFQRRLLPRERILWSGIPAQGVLFAGRDVFLIPFSLLWCGFAIFWTYSASMQGAPLFFDVWGAMFICIGLFFVFGRFAVDAWLRRRTSYAVTDKRILIMRTAPFANFTSIDLERLPDIQLSGEGQKRGNLRFGAATSFFGNPGGWSQSRYQNFGSWAPALDPVPQFLGVEDPSRVFDIITRASNALRSDRRAPPDT